MELLISFFKYNIIFRGFKTFVFILKMTNNEYQELFKFRSLMYKRFLDGKISLLDFVHGSFNFLNQNKIRHIAKPTTREQVLVNYLFWQIHIERKVMIERDLIDHKLGSKDWLDQAIFMYIKRRDQMLRRLFFDLQEPIKEAYIIVDDVVEVVLNDGNIVYTTIESMSKIKVDIQNFKKTIQPKYIPALVIK